MKYILTIDFGTVITGWSLGVVDSGGGVIHWEHGFIDYKKHKDNDIIKTVLKIKNYKKITHVLWSGYPGGTITVEKTEKMKKILDETVVFKQSFDLKWFRKIAPDCEEIKEVKNATDYTHWKKQKTCDYIANVLSSSQSLLHDDQCDALAMLYFSYLYFK